MEKRLKSYIAFIEGINLSDMTELEKEAFRSAMLVQIGFFQHERLIHLIVTMTFALLTLMPVIAGFAWPGVIWFIMIGLFLALLIPYIRHYFILENGVQKLYGYYDRLAGE